jgi:hypothetical protein
MKEEIEDHERSGMIDLSDIENLKNKYHINDEQLREATDAVGNNYFEVDAYLQEKYSEYNNDQDQLKGIAVNPNPRANANIKDEIKNKTPSQLREEKSQPGNEITDGEDG